MARPIRILLAASAAVLAAACSQTSSTAPNPSLLGSDENGFSRGSRTARAATPGTIEDFRSQSRDIVYFASDSTDLNPESMATLDNQARWLGRYPSHTIVIEGHADERGTREYNLALGARRAQSVRAYLVSKGIPASRIRSLSYGKERPVAVCDDISCWSQNRRAQTILNGLAVSQR
ncbi:MAG: peptidoglycan-associated lipoprotein Pal [Hyphomicrobium sp.]|nr:peptidoglycan-associated lipoprotein Pal [Hyphomicrobium sp.]